MNVVINSCIDTVPEGSLPIPNQSHYYHHILSCLGYPLLTPPVADLLRKWHGLDGVWLVVSPIHWQATHNDAMIVAAGEDLQLTELEGHQWFEAFAEFVSAETMRVHYHDASTWLIQLSEHPIITAQPVQTMLHQSMMPHLDGMDHTFFWQRFMTESQMFLSNHALNTSRIGRYSINGLWIWGGGVLQTRSKCTIVVDNQHAFSLATLLSLNVSFYSAERIYPRDALVLWSDLSRLKALQAKLTKQTVSWYWNNCTYQTKPKHWLKRLWSSKHHAD
ncbi:MAG: hypothetical protein Q8R24_01050 [Legionellaceae bacterium]|nr:hypothetical protein [Legionellaceae bacterium]